MAAAARIVLPTDHFEQQIVPADPKAAMERAGVEFKDGYYRVNPKSLYVMPGYNMRVHGARYKERVKYLKASMEINGWDDTEPITVFAAMVDDLPTLVIQDGHHREDAALEAGIESVTINVRPGETTNADLQYALILKNSGEPPSPYEAAVVVKRLANQGEPKKTIAKKLAVTVRYVDDLLVLADAPKEVIDAVVNEQMAATLAVEQLRQYDAEDVVKMLHKALNKAAAQGKKRVTAKALEGHEPVEKKAKTRSPGKAPLKLVEPAPADDSMIDFFTVFEGLYSENANAAYEIAFDSKVGHAATLLTAPTDEGGEVIAQGVGATPQLACAAAVKQYHDKRVAEAAEDL